ncbi:unnamed protein product [Pelagomonas calceolata]|uniref:Uncharacterized protein n=1 Tax=Pelagomonas calceolata TaxID=35677 RepID=A0A8J2WR93_9STRA|nr:unnamed protein product [Pelagomonas calceolata]
MSRRTNHVWRCDICNSCTNPVRAPKCIICGTPAPRTRFGTFSHGRYVLVDLRTGRNAAEARIHELATDVVHIEELPAGDDLEERIADALKSALDDDFREARRLEAPRLASRARRRLKHEKQSYETKQDAKVLKGDLFAQVLQRDRNEENAAIMRKQYATMRRRVQIQQEEIEDSETILIRKRCEDGSIDEHRVDRDEASVLIDKEAELRAKYTPCGCCEREFRGRCLLGVASFHQVAEWRSQHNAPFPPNDPRFAISKRYEPIRLCVFCTQFFDQDFSDYMSIAQYSHTHRKGVELEPCLQLGPARAKERRHLKEEAPVVIEDKVERPSSVLRDRMAKSELLMRAAVPLKLDPYGSHLSDLARKPVVTTLRRGYTRKKRTMLPNSAKERQFTPVSKERLEDMKPARRKPRKLGQRRRVDKLPPLLPAEDEEQPSPSKRRPRSLSHKKKRAYVVEQKRRAEAAAYGGAPRRRRARRPGQTESLRRDRRRTEQHFDQLTSVRRGASSVDEDSAFEDSDELAAEAEIAELKRAIAAERAKGGG